MTVLRLHTMSLCIVIPNPFFPPSGFSSSRCLTNKCIHLLWSAGVWVAMIHTALWESLGFTLPFALFTGITEHKWIKKSESHATWFSLLCKKPHTSQVKWKLAQTATGPSPLPKHPDFTHIWLIFEEHCLLPQILSCPSNIIPVSKRHLLNPVVM